MTAADHVKFSDCTVRRGGHTCSTLRLRTAHFDACEVVSQQNVRSLCWITAEEALRLGLANRVALRAKLTEEMMPLAQRIALQDPFAVRLAKFSLHQIQDEMGFRTAINGAFQTYAFPVA